MTVAELIDELKKHNPALLVVIDAGVCDEYSMGNPEEYISPTYFAEGTAVLNPGEENYEFITYSRFASGPVLTKSGAISSLALKIG